MALVSEVKAELIALRAKVDEAIAHVDSGVENLNEDQIEKLGKLIDEIDEGALDARDNVGRIIGRKRFAAPVEHPGDNSTSDETKTSEDDTKEQSSETNEAESETTA